MLHTEDKKVRELLFSGNMGLERESLRIMPNGSFSHTYHPFSEEESHIVYDFCENQTEVNTSVGGSPEEAWNYLRGHVRYIQRTLSEMDEPELLWPFSNPPYIKNEADIPIARHVESAGYREGYREFLADRYGRYKMALCGIHVNFSFAEDLLKADFAASGQTDYSEYKNDLYVVLAERAAAYGWIITALTAASPVFDGSYIEKGRSGTSYFNGMASTRCSELGYWNYFAPVLDYTDIRKYADSIRKYVDEGMISTTTELYYPIRLKPTGKNNLKRLHDEGVSHIELRMVDLNPYDEAGVSLYDLKFIHFFLIWLIGSDRQSFHKKDQVQAVQNFKNAAHYDLKTVKIVIPTGEAYSADEAGRHVIGFMRDFYRDLSGKYKGEGLEESFDQVFEILDFEEAKFIDPERRYAWRVRKEFEEDYVKKGLAHAQRQQDEAISCVNYSEYQAAGQ